MAKAASCCGGNSQLQLLDKREANEADIVTHASRVERETDTGAYTKRSPVCEVQPSRWAGAAEGTPGVESVMGGREEARRPSPSVEP